MSKVKSILFKIEIEGNGVVNYDSNEQRFHIGEKFPFLKSYHSNVMYAKRNIYNDGKEPRFKLVISPTCMKHAMYDKVSQTPKLTHNKDLLYANLAHPESILNGHLHAIKNDTLKRKGAITLVAAEQTCDALSRLEFHSKSGEKISYEADEEKSDNSIYKKETIGKIKYSSQGAINLKELQFYSCDEIMGRYGFNPDHFDLFKKYADIHFGSFDNELGFFQMRGSSVNIAERGFKFTDDQVRLLVSVFLEKLLTLDISRSSAYARKEKLMVKLVSNPLIDRFNSEEGWVEINSIENIQALQYEVFEAYTEDVTGDAKKLHEELKKYAEEERATLKKNSVEKKAKAAKQKAEKVKKTETTPA